MPPLTQKSVDVARRPWRIAEKVSDAIVILNTDRIITFVNDAAVRLAGQKSASDLLGVFYPDVLSQFRILHEDGTVADPATFPSEVVLQQNSDVQNRVFALIDKKNHHHWLSVSAFPLYDEDGALELVTILYRDITRRKSRDDKLKFLIESSQIFSITTDLNTRLREKTRLLIPPLADWATINLLNEKEELARLAVEHRDRTKTPLLERFAALAADNPQSSVIHRVAATGISEIYVAIGPTAGTPTIAASPEGRPLFETLNPCSAMIVPIRSDGRTLGVLSVAYSDSGRHYDTEDLEFMEEFGRHLAIVVDNARLYQEIAKRDANKDAFLATLSHEMRNPLAPIKASLEILRLKNPDPSVEHELFVIEHQFDQMEKLLRDLLDVSRFTLGKMHLRPSLFDLAVLTKVVTMTHERELARKHIRLSVSLPASSVWISGDTVRIEQVLANLLSNANKFTPEDGHIEVSLKVRDHRAILSVADNGIGVAKEDIGKIFEQYFQGTSQAPRLRSGLGMGLLLVRQIVRMHGGEVQADSAGEGHGCTFTVSLPIEKTPRIKKEPKEEQRGIPGVSRDILVIDDNKAAADSLVTLLNAVGYRARAAYSGTGGLEAFARSEPDRVIVDIGMPDIDGYEVARQLRQKGTEARLIALSGYGMEEDKRRAHEAGFDLHLTKPVGLKELRVALEPKEMQEV